MDRKVDCRASVQGTKGTRRTKAAPSSQQLAKQYLDLQCLRRQVRMAETGQIASPELAELGHSGFRNRPQKGSDSNGKESTR